MPRKRLGKADASPKDDELRLYIGAEEVSLSQLHHVTGAWANLLREVAASVSGGTKDTFRFVITEAKAGSLELAVRPVVAKKRVPPKIAKAAHRISKVITAGIRELSRQKRPRRPAYFTDEALESARELAEETLNAKTVTVSNGTGKAILMDRQVLQNIDELIGPQFESIGTVEGKLEGVIIHGRRRFLIYDSLTGREVKCYFDENRLADRDVLGAFGQRVAATGTIASRRTGEKLSIEVRRLEVFPSDEPLPAPDQVLRLIHRDSA